MNIENMLPENPSNVILNDRRYFFSFRRTLINIILIESNNNGSSLV